MKSHPALRLLSAALAGLVAAGATPWQIGAARADEAAKVVVLPFRVIQDQVSESLAPKTTDILADELHNRDDVILTTYKAPAAPAAKEGGGPAAEPTTGVQAGLEQIKKGEDLVKHFKFKPAAETLEAGIADYEAFPVEVDLKVLREAYTQLALAKMRSGDNEGGLSALSDVVRLAPEQPLAPGYPPPFKRAFDQAKRKTLAGSRVSVVIRGEGNIDLDGKDQGAAPTTVQNVLQGAHFLRIKRPDGTAWGLKLMVGDGENTVTIPTGDGSKRPAVAAAPEAPKGALGALALNRIDDATLAEVAAAAREAGADYAVFGGIYKTADGVGCAAHVYSARARGEVALKPISFDTDFVSAGIEANKLAGELGATLKKFPAPEALPAPVAAALASKPVVAAVVRPEVKPEVKPEEKKPIVIKRKPENDEGPKVAVVEKPHEDAKPAETEGGVRTLSHKSTMTDPAAGGLQSTAEADAHKGKDEGGSSLWLYGVVGGVAAAAIAGGVAGFLVYNNNHTPVTGSASLSFQ